MRAYGVLPSEVTATGPKGFILKGDVLKIVRGNKLLIYLTEYFIEYASLYIITITSNKIYNM